MKNIEILIGNKIKDLRLKKGFSQEKLAELSNLHRTYIGMVERGERSITVKRLKQILESLDLSLEEFFRDL